MFNKDVTEARQITVVPEKVELPTPVQFQNPKKDLPHLMQLAKVKPDVSTAPVRQLGKQDVKAICDVHNSSALENNPDTSKGFMLDRLGENDVHTDKYLYYGVFEWDKLVAYIKLDTVPEDIQRDTKLTSDVPEFRGEGEHLYTANIATHADYKRMGYGTRLYEQVLEQNPDKTFMAYGVKAPVHNLATEKFHLKAGFKKVGTFQRDEFDGYKNYQSTLFRRGPIQKS